MKKNYSELDKELDLLSNKFKDLDIKFSDLWKGLESRLEKSISSIDGIDSKLGRILADISTTLLKSGMSELTESGTLDSFLAPIVNMGNEFFGIIPSNNTPANPPKNNDFGMSSSQILSDLSSALGKISRNF